MNTRENDLMLQVATCMLQICRNGPQVLTHGVRLGGLDVHVARLFDGLHHQLLHAGEETLNIQVIEAKQLREATAEHDG